MQRFFHILLFCLLALPLRGQVIGRVLESATGLPVVGAAVTGGDAWALTDTTGRFALRVASGVRLTVTCMGYKTLSTAVRADGIYRLEADIMALQEVVVTAKEDHGLTATTRIGEDAISHIQPSSIADVLELLPGGLARDPSFGSAQLINLRSAGSLSSDYATSALGTRFLIDGRPVSNDANLQSTPAWSGLGSSFVNYGTDMRTLSTEDIESVDVVRGIASVEYGDLTSGLVKIVRKKGGEDLRARFKADMKSKLFYVGKGFEWGDRDKLTMNMSANYLDAQSDPRNPRQNYSRLTGSWRVGKSWNSGADWRYVLDGSIDYTGSFDTEKSDADLDEVDGYGPVETYRSSYNKIDLAGNFSVYSKSEDRFFRSFSAQASLSFERDLIDRWKHIALGSERPMSTALDPGEHDVVSLPTRYDATLQVDGRPFYAFANAVANFTAGIHKIKAGAEWNMDKNNGKGTIFDPTRPFSTDMSVRPRPYDAIPANHQLSLFVEENFSLPLGGWNLEAAAGLRASAMAGAGRAFDIEGKPYLDPRFNLRLELPEQVVGGYRLEAGLFGGAGWHTKFPTMDMLYPDPVYADYTQLNYWPQQVELRRINLLVTRFDPTNFALHAARNFKWEIGLDASWNGFDFSIDYFREDMTSGFRNGTLLEMVVYKDYDESAIDKSTLTGPPSLETLPYILDTLLTGRGTANNGSRTLKQGIEFTLSTKRIAAIGTRFTANGAWFHTRNMNSMPEYWRPSVAIEGKRYPYIGLYDKNDGRLNESLTTSLMADTQIPRLGLIFSTSLQAVWFTGSKPSEEDKDPVAWIDKEGGEHPFTEADRSDAVLGFLVRDYNSVNYVYNRIPFAMNVNLKVMKKLYHDKVSVSVFVNKILDVTPDYYRNNVLVRRNVLPYFGMELDFKL